MPQVPCNRQNPHLVVPHLIVRTPLPAGHAVVEMTHVQDLDTKIACNTLRIQTLETWREDVADPSLSDHGSRISVLEGLFTALDFPGMIVPYAGDTPPTGWLMCDGGEHSVDSHSRLHDLIQYTYGGGGDTFKVPDLRSQFVRGYAGVGAVGDTFANRTAAPASGASIPTGSGGEAHVHMIGSGKLSDVANHSHPVTINSGDASHTHPTSEAANHNHGYGSGGGSTGTSGTHTHFIGSGSTPVAAYPAASLPTPRPYAGNETFYDNMDTTAGYNFFITTPNVTTVDWSTDQAPGHQHDLAASGAHSHTALSATASHPHTGSSSPAGGHSHTGSTDSATASHAHIVSKAAGWDTETRPQGMLLNFIIRF